MAGTAGLDAGLGAMMAKMAGVKAESEASMAGVAKVGVALSAAVAAGTVVVAVEAVKMAGEFQASVTKLGTTAGEAQGNLKMVGDGMLEMAGQVGISAQDLAKGMYTVESAGFHGADALTVMKSAAEGAKQEQADLGHVTDAVSTALHDYHLPASAAADVTSQLITAVSHGKTTFDELTGAMHSVTPIASAAHLSLADVTGTLASMTASGMSADQAGQNLGHTIQRFSGGGLTQPMIKELAALGITAQDLVNNLGDEPGKTGLAATLQQVSTAILTKMGPSGTVLMDTMNQSTQAGHDAGRMFEALPPAAHKVAQAITDNTLSYKEFRKTGAGLDVEQRTQVSQWAALHDKAVGFSQAIKSGSIDSQNYVTALAKATGGQESLSVMLQTTGENAKATNAAITDIAGSTKQADGNIKGWSEVQGNFNQQMDELKATLGALVTKLGIELLPTVTKVAEGFKTGITWVTGHKEAMAAMAGVISGALIVALYALSVALWAIATNPVVITIELIAAALALLGVGVYELWTHWHQIWGWITGQVTAANQQILGAWNDVKNWTVSIWHAVTGYLVGAWNDMTHAVMTGVHAVVDPVVGAWHAVQNWTVSAWNSVVGYLVGAWSDMTHATATGWHAVVDPVVEAWHWVENITSVVWNGIKAFFEKWWPLLLVVFATPIALLIGMWNHFHEQITAVVVGVWNGVKTFLSDTWNWMKDTAQTAWNLLRDYIVNPITEAARWVDDKITALADWIRGKWDELVGLTRSAWNTLVADTERSWQLVYDQIIAPIERAYGWLVGKLSDLGNWIAGKWDDIAGFTARIWNTITTSITTAWNGIVESIQRISGDIAQAIWAPFRAVEDWMDTFTHEMFLFGTNIIMGTVHGIESVASKMGDAVKNAASSALDGAKGLLGISSPSKVFADEIGVHIPAGIAQGILANSGVLSSALASVTGPITGPQFSAGGGPGATFGATMPGGGQQPIIVNITGNYYGFGGASQAASDIRDELLKLQQRTPLGFRAS